MRNYLSKMIDAVMASILFVKKFKTCLEWRMSINTEGDWFNLEGENDLDRLILKSDLMETDLVDQKKLELLLKNKKWLGTFYEFLYGTSKSRSQVFDLGKNPTVLGLSMLHDVPQALAKHIHGKEWDYGNYDAETISGINKYMRCLLTDPEVTSVIFVIPDHLMSHVESGSLEITKKEFRFLLDNPSLAKKVYLVFGGYDTVNGDKMDNELGLLAKGNLSHLNLLVRQEARKKLVNEFRSFIKSVGDIDKPKY